MQNLHRIPRLTASRRVTHSVQLGRYVSQRKPVPPHLFHTRINVGIGFPRSFSVHPRRSLTSLSQPRQSLLFVTSPVSRSIRTQLDAACLGSLQRNLCTLTN